MKSLLLFLLLSTPALARINETPAQSEARYGKPTNVSEDGKIMNFEKAGISIMCEFHDGLCDSIFFQKTEITADADRLPFTEEEARILLESDSDGVSWHLEYEDKEKGRSSWRNGSVRASVSTKAPSQVWIYTLGHSRRSSEKSKKEKDAQKKGTLKDF